MWAIRLLHRAYKITVVPFIGDCCRYYPSCSDYALDALEQHGFIRGGYLALLRVLRCNPYGGKGFDPVPCFEQHKEGCNDE